VNIKAKLGDNDRMVCQSFLAEAKSSLGLTCLCKRRPWVCSAPWNRCRGGSRTGRSGRPRWRECRWAVRESGTGLSLHRVKSGEIGPAANLKTNRFID